jgi:hypothetical protein
MGELPFGTVTFLFTDIEGSTRLWQEDESSMRKAVARHDQLLVDVIENHNGVVFSTMGDGVAAAFESAVDAVFSEQGSRTPTPSSTLVGRRGLEPRTRSLKDVPQSFSETL